MNIVGTIDSLLSQKGNHVWTIAPNATVYEAIELMAAKNIGSLLVMDGERLAGVITERDYTRKVALKGKSSRQTPVAEILSPQVITVGRDHSIEACMKLMTKHRIRHLPVVEGEQVLGVVSIGDLVNWTISAQHVAIEQMEDYISGKYPG
jgi:CBS domain-containing protein